MLAVLLFSGGVLSVKYSVKVQLLDGFASERVILSLGTQHLVLGLVISRMRRLVVYISLTVDNVVAFMARDRLEASHVTLSIELQRLIVA